MELIGLPRPQLNLVFVGIELLEVEYKHECICLSEFWGVVTSKSMSTFVSRNCWELLQVE
jgi:hypothetical protein